MSWFSEMAGKAETFLNKMDQTAAAALTGSMSEGTSDSMSSDSTAIVPVSLVTYQPRYTAVASAAPVPSHSRTSSIGSSFSTVSSRDIHSNGNIGNSFFTPPPHKSSSSKNRSDSDEKMIEFLNSKSVPPSKTSSTGRSSRPSDEDQSIEVVSVSSDEGRQQMSGKETPVSDGKNEEDITETDSLMTLTDIHPDDMSLSKEAPTEINKEQESGIIASLEKEISALTRKNVAAETEIKRLAKRLENWQNQMSSSDASLRELQAREEDLRSAIRVKDESISILRVRQQESDELLQAKTESLSRLQLEYELLSKDNVRAQADLDQDIVSLQARVRELEQELLTEKESLQKSQSDSMMQIGVLEENNRVLVDELGSVQRELRSEKSLRKECEKQCKQLRGSFDSLAAEFDEYKCKAVKTLQSKDDLIRNLQRKSNEGDEGIADTNDFQVDYDESNKQTLVLQTQCDALVQEVQELQARNESLKAEIDRIRNEEMEDMNSQILRLNHELDEERRNKNETENELRQVQDELRYSRADFDRIRSSLQTRIDDRDKEVEQLRKQLVSKRSSPAETSVQELEQRCRGLTQSLIQKQTLIEQLSSERHSLALQLERSDARLRNALEDSRSQMSSPSVSIGIHSDSTSLTNRNGYRQLVEDDPRDGQVTRRVKRVYSQFDSFSIRMGQFLRVYPPARAFVLVYVLFLHLWVFFVLFSYRPEIHDQDP
jgi:hypothetical protein